MVAWDEDINFASALLLHSCLTVLVKELLNLLSVILRTTPFRRNVNPKDDIARSLVLDGYTSILSSDADGNLAELYFTNTGLMLLSVTLASAISMNLFLSDAVLNAFVACTFGFCYIVSIFACGGSWLRFVLALRRAGRFVWSDTPFVNFFSLIYVAVVLKNGSTMRLKDYMTLRSIAIFELVFMKAYLAASSMDKQIELLRSLCKSRFALFQSKILSDELESVSADTSGLNLQQKPKIDIPEPPRLSRGSIVPFTTTQRLSVMLFKTTIGHEFGSVRGPKGPSTIPVPPVGCFANDDVAGEWRVYRLADDIMMISDTLRKTEQKGAWKKFISQAHGIFLKQLRKVRVVYLLREDNGGDSGFGQGDCNSAWISNVNLVTGVSESVLELYSLAEDETLQGGVLL